jgi:hypothetical protein
MVQGLPGIVASMDWVFAPDIFPQPPQNIATEIPIRGVSWWNKFLMRNAYKNESTLISHCFNLVMLSWVAVNLVSSNEMTDCFFVSWLYP